MKKYKRTDRRKRLSRHLYDLADKLENLWIDLCECATLLETTEDEQKTGPVQVREEVVGTSTKGKNKNMGNSGFSGGIPVAA